MREAHRLRAADNATQLRLLDFLLHRPVISVRMADEHLGCSYVTAANAIDELQRNGLITETTGQRRNRLFRYAPYLELFDRQALAVQDDQTVPVQTTQPEKAPTDGQN